MKQVRKHYSEPPTIEILAKIVWLFQICNIPKSQGHWPFVPENKIFKGFLPYMGVVALTFEAYL